MDNFSNFVGPAIDWFAISPMLALLGGALLLVLVGSLTGQWKRGLYGVVCSATGLVSIVLSVMLWGDVRTSGPRTVINNALAIDHLALLGFIGVSAVVVLISLITSDDLARQGTDSPEIYALYLTAAIGGLVMVAANDLIVLFLGLETLSLSFYALAASNRDHTESQEAGLKYFVLGGFASAFFLYGVALTYGVSGSTQLTAINTTLTGYMTIPRNDLILLIGIGLMLVGFAFKVSLAPFHSWTPDVYQGSPTTVTALMASLGKITALVALVRVFIVAFPSRVDDWGPIVLVLSGLTLVIGSVVAVVQTNIKRMLAYSSISHAGFILVGLEAASHRDMVGSSNGLESIGIYVLIYAVLVIGTFGVVAVVARDTNVDSTSLKAFSGLAKNQPILALSMTILLLAQAGIPLTSGFVAKFGVISAAVTVGSYELAVMAMIFSVVAAFVYLRIIVSIWLSDPASDDLVVVPVLSKIAIGITVAITVIVGVMPSLLLDQTVNLAQLVTK